MDTRKITLIATIAVIALVAVGIGYAYTASTQNSGNNAQSEYITLTQSNDVTDPTIQGAYKFTGNNTASVYFDTVNTGVNTTSYKLSSQTKDIVISEDHYTVVGVGKSFYINAEPTNVKFTEVANNLECVVTTGGFIVEDGWYFIVQVVTKDNSGNETTVNMVYNGTTWTPNHFTIYETGAAASAFNQATVTVCYGYKANAALPTTAPNDKPLDNAWIQFTATYSGSNTGNNYYLTANPYDDTKGTFLIKVGNDTLSSTLPNTIAANTQFTVTPSPATGYAATVTVATVDDGTPIIDVEGKYTMPAEDVTVTVEFSLKKNNVTLTTGEDYTITGATTADYEHAYVATVTGKTITGATVTIGGAPKTAVTDFTVDTVNGTITILVHKVTDVVVITPTFT